MEKRDVQETATRLSKVFLKKLVDGIIVEACRPNRGREYTGAYEQLDLLEYKRFLVSYAYCDLFKDMEVEYGQY